MCGINIIVDRTKGRFGPEAIQRMNAALRHRGPDGEPHFERIDLDWATIWLGATRLALRGGAAGRQPMHSPGGRITLVYNGEIYNLAEGYGSDTAALAALLEKEYDPDAFLNGIYAFAYVDRRDQSLHVARDMWGVKPLFVGRGAFGLAFSSEAEALLEVGVWPGAYGDRVDAPMPMPQSSYVKTWLDYRHLGPDGSLFGYDSQVTEEVGFSFPDDMNIITEVFWNRKSYAEANLAARNLAAVNVESLQTTMIEVLERQLVSDRPVGLMLSGGHDSAFLLACLAAMGRKLPCYTLAGTPDAEPAARMAAKLGFEHRLVPMPNHWPDLEAYMQGRIHPIADSGGFATWLVARAARQDGVPVLLSGAGADELLGGYRRHRLFYRMQRLAGTRLRYQMQADIFKRLTRWNGLGQLSISEERAEQRTHYPKEYDGRFYDPRLTDLNDYLIGDVLMVTDQATMAHGVEARVPYLDNAVVARLMGIPWMELMRAGYKAPLVPALKEAGLFSLLLKKKTGFGLWNTALFEGLPVLERLRRPGHVLYGYLHFGKVQKALQGGSPHARFLICQLAYTLEFIQSYSECDQRNGN